MVVSVGSSSSSLSWVAASSSSASFPSSSGSHRPRGISKLSLLRGVSHWQRCHLQQLTIANTGGGHSCKFVFGKQKFSKRKLILFATSQDHSLIDEPNSDSLEPETQPETDEDVLSESNFPTPFEAGEGKPGFISFYDHSYRGKGKIEVASSSSKHQSSFIWFVGPTVLVASFIFPSLYLRRILSAVFEDSLLTDFLILFFTEALFYCGVAVFLLLIDHSQRPLDDQSSFSKSNDLRNPKLVYRISSVATLVLSLIIPMVTMGFVWPWTGPAASATLAPYLVGIVVQFAFEQYARYVRSPSWPVIPIVFQIYRLHQLNRAAQLVTALSFTVRGAETTSHNLAISSSLGTLLNVLQFLGVVCIWSLASFLMRFLPSVPLRTDSEAS